MDNVIEVKWIGRQSAEDLYKTLDSPRRVFVRQPSNVKDTVFWLTACKWQGGFEANCPIKAGIVIKVVDNDRNELFAEELVPDDCNGGTIAMKKGLFSYEAIKEMTGEIAKEFDLIDHNDWCKWLLGYKRKHRYKGYDDNWLYWNIETVQRFLIKERFSYLGRKCHLAKETLRHKVADVEWECYTLVDEEDMEVLGICGYKFDTEK